MTAIVSVAHRASGTLLDVRHARGCSIHFSAISICD